MSRIRDAFVTDYGNNEDCIAFTKLKRNRQRLCPASCEGHVVLR